MKKDSYKLGKILATSAIVSDAPLGPPKPNRTKLNLVILAVILGYVGFAVYSNSAKADIWDEGQKIGAEEMVYEFWEKLEKGQLKLLHSSKDKKGMLHSVFWSEQKGMLSCYMGYRPTDRVNIRCYLLDKINFGFRKDSD